MLPGAYERELEVIADRFAAAAAESVRESLTASVERFVADHPDAIEALDDETMTAFRSSVAAAIETATRQVATRLRERDLWTSPRVRVREDAPLEETSLVDWFLGGLGLRPRRPPDESEERLDDPNNRVWIALLNAADPIDPVFTEFGLVPSRAPDMGGGHFGLQPRRLQELDPRRRLTPIWREYREAFAAHRRALGSLRRRRAAARRTRVLARWRRQD